MAWVAPTGYAPLYNNNYCICFFNFSRIFQAKHQVWYTSIFVILTHSYNCLIYLVNIWPIKKFLFNVNEPCIPEFQDLPSRSPMYLPQFVKCICLNVLKILSSQTGKPKLAGVDVDLPNPQSQTFRKLSKVEPQWLSFSFGFIHKFCSQVITYLNTTVLHPSADGLLLFSRFTEQHWSSLAFSLYPEFIGGWERN